MSDKQPVFVLRRFVDVLHGGHRWTFSTPGARRAARWPAMLAELGSIETAPDRLEATILGMLDELQALIRSVDGEVMAPADFELAVVTGQDVISLFGGLHRACSLSESEAGKSGAQSDEP